MQNKQPIQGTRTIDLTTEIVSTRLTKTDDDFESRIVGIEIKSLALIYSISMLWWICLHSKASLMKILLKERRRREGQGSNYSSKKKYNSYRRKSTTMRLRTMRTLQLWFARKRYLFVRVRMKFVLFRHTFRRSFINSHGKFKSVKFKLLLSLPPTRIFASISFSSRKIIFRNFWEAFLGCAKLAGSSKPHCRVLLLLIINLKSLSFMEHGVN